MSLLFATEQHGVLGTLGYRLFLRSKATGRRVSPWHDVPLRPKEKTQESEVAVVHMVCEMPRGTTRKMEIVKEELFNPIAQNRTKLGLPRVIKHGAVLHNYGSIPQTWSNPESVGSCGGICRGDDDPVDVVEIGNRKAKCGEVLRVRVLGALGLVDGGKMDWKIIAVDADDPQCAILNSVGDVEKRRPSVVGAIREWYRVYKVAEGKPLNSYVFGGRAMDRDHAMAVIEESHDDWSSLIKRNPAAIRRE